MKLNPPNVDTLFRSCLFKNGEDASDPALASGIMLNVGFHRGRLTAAKPEIIELLGQLPASFMATAGGGWSFLNACNDKDGQLWTGSHAVMEQLFLLGLASDLVTELMPREQWSVLPGGMPYYVVRNDRFAVAN